MLLVSPLDNYSSSMTFLTTTATATTGIASKVVISNLKNSLLVAAASLSGTKPTGSTTTALQSSPQQEQEQVSNPFKNKANVAVNNTRRMWPLNVLSPRSQSCLYMSIAMALHFGGYEFVRSGALALFTSADTGFTSPAAYPFAIGLVTPVSLLFLYWYGIQLKASGPRIALRRTTIVSISVLSISSLALKILLPLLSSSSPPMSLLPFVCRGILAILFVFQNSYAHLLYTQQWSFLGSVMTPTEGTKWFSAIAGLSSLVCTGTGTIVHTLAHHIGLLGLVVGTCATLTLSLLFADSAYDLSQKHGFDPAKTMDEKRAKKENSEEESDNESSLLTKTGYLFRRVPTLASLFCEVICFQSLSTILNVCFVRQLKESLPVDTDRASFTGRMFALINGTAGLMQFFVLPLTRKYVEPRWVYKGMPFLLLPMLCYMNWAVLTTSTNVAGHMIANRSLTIAAAAFFCLKTLDYALRNVVNEMVYQPLDFESRYLGKEVIGVFANRFGKSGMSLILSLATATFSIGVQQLSQFSLVVAGLWTTSCWVLSGYLPSNREAEQRVQQQRQRSNKKED